MFQSKRNFFEAKRTHYVGAAHAPVVQPSLSAAPAPGC